MTKIPYTFNTPIPRYFIENGWFPLDNPERYFKNMTFLQWAFSKCSTIPHKVFHDHKEILLEPFEFICGRNKSSNECGLTEKEFRGQLKNHINAGTLKKGANSVANRFTCYIWVTEHFSVFKGQLMGQPRANRGPTEGPQTRTETKETKDIKETFPCPDSFLLNIEKDSNIFEVVNLCKINSLHVQEITLMTWIKKFPSIQILDNLIYMLSGLKKVDNHEKWMENALKKDIAGKEKRVEINRKFVQQFILENPWPGLEILKNYARDNGNNGHDFQYALPIEEFKRSFEVKFNEMKEREVENCG